MKVCQVSGSDVAYEAAKSTTSTNSSKEDTGFRNILKNKSTKANSYKSKTGQSQKGKEEKINDDSLSTKETVSADKTSGYEIPIEIVSNLFSQVALPAVQTNGTNETNETSQKSETSLIQSITTPLSIAANESSNESGNEVSKIQQKVMIYTLGSLGLRSLEGKMVSAKDNLQVKDNDSESKGSNGQEILKALDIKKDSVVLATDQKSTGLNENGSQKSSEKTSLFSKSNLMDEASDDLKGLSTFVFEPKEDMVNIKVAEPTVTKSWQAAAGEIGEAIVESIKDNKIEKLNISLNPKELGEIKIEFVIENDKVSVSLICSNEKTKGLLAENTNTLSKIIQSNLHQETSVNVSYNEKSNHQESNSENFDGSGNNSHYKEDSQQHNRRDEDSDKDFLQKLKLGIVDIEKMEV